jgi:predicted ABC-type ATPase
LSDNSNTDQLRLRVFAGPNGSGKSTIIQSVKNTTINDRKIDLGIYINADDIAGLLKNNKFSFAPYQISVTKKEFIRFAELSGLLTPELNTALLQKLFKLKGTQLLLSNRKFHEQLAQLLARFLRECLLKEKKRFSFETVFSHPSNLEIMKRAADAGYKVYLYFVSTESPVINKYRVKLRVFQKGHDVPEDKIESRYYRSLELLFSAAETVYQAFFFDNSSHDQPFKLVNHFKKIEGKKNWDTTSAKHFSNWFKNYYWKKSSLLISKKVMALIPKEEVKGV